MLGQLENVQRDLSIKEVELKHLTLQLELLTNQNAAHVDKLQEEITALKVRAAVFKTKTQQKTPCFEANSLQLHLMFVLFDNEHKNISWISFRNHKLLYKFCIRHLSVCVFVDEAGV